MPKHKLLLYSDDNLFCPCNKLSWLPNFETTVVNNGKELKQQLNNSENHAALICGCSVLAEFNLNNVNWDNYINSLIELNKFAVKFPLIACSTKLDPHFVISAYKKGFGNFFLCDADPNEIELKINNYIAKNNLRHIIMPMVKNRIKHNIILEKFFAELEAGFPQKPDKKTICKNLNISERWLQKIVKDTFEMTYKELIRLIWVTCIITFNNYSNLTLDEIAEQFGYNESRSLARDFYKIFKKSARNILSATKFRYD